MIAAPAPVRQSSESKGTSGRKEGGAAGDAEKVVGTATEVKDDAEKDVNALPDIPIPPGTISRVFKLVKSDWHLLLISMICAAVNGVSWPLFSIVFSEMTSKHSIQAHSMCCAGLCTWPSR